MIEDRIEEAARMYAFNECSKKDIDQYDLDSLLFDAFCSGINWFKENLWHDASEELEQMKNILIEFPNGNCYACYRSGNYYKTPNISDDRYDIIDAKDIKRWLYIEDLMKGGK